MDRTALRQLCRDLLGVKATDAFYTDSRVDSMLNVAEHQIAEEIRRQAPDILRNAVTLAADTSSSNTYTFATQAPPITDFSEVLELRLTDSKGCKLTKVPDGELDGYLGTAYSLIGPDKAPIVTTGQDIAAGTPLYLKYARRTSNWPNPSDSPESVPDDYHDVVGFMATELLFELGGESRLPPTIAKWGLDRRGALWHHIGRRSSDPMRVKGDDVLTLVETVRR